MINSAVMECKVFSNRMFGTIRTMLINGEPYFVGRDVASALGYANTKDALINHIDDEDKSIIRRSERTTFDVPNRGLTIINESGLYSLILSSKLPSAKAFKRWVTSEVLPEVRKTGTYLSEKEKYYMAADEKELMAKALMTAQGIIMQLQPKALYADVMQQGRILIGDFAEILKRNGIETGSLKLYAWLRQNGYLKAAGAEYNTPTDWALSMELFETEEFEYGPANGSAVSKKVYITGKGQQYFIELFMSAKEREKNQERCFLKNV